MRKSKYVVVDLGASAIKAVVMQDGVIAHRVTLEPAQDRAAQLKEMLQSPEMRKLPVHLLLTSSATRVYTLRFPNSRDKDQLRTAQQNAMDKALGSLGNEYEIRAFGIKAEAVREQLAVTVPRRTLEEAGDLTKAATISVNGVHAPVLVGQHDQGRAIIDIGAKHTVVSIVEDGLLRRVKVIDMGGDDFTRALEGLDGADWAAAEQLKAESRLDNTDAGSRLQATCDNLMQLISQALDEYRAHGGEIKRVQLTGGGSRMRGLVESFNQLMGVRCEILTLPEDISAEEAAVWGYASSLHDLSNREAASTIDFTPRASRKRLARNDTTMIAPGFVIDKRDTDRGRRISLLWPGVLSLAVVIAMATAYFLLSEMTDTAQSQQRTATDSTRSLAASIELDAPAAFLAANDQALDLAAANERQAKLMDGVDKLEQLLSDEGVPSTTWTQTGYDQITLEGTGVLPTNLGDKKLQETIEPARLLDVRQTQQRYAIIVGVPS